jgi:hypothetical protein
LAVSFSLPSTCCFRLIIHTIVVQPLSQAVGLYSGIRRCPQPIETHKDPPKLLEHTRSFPASPKLLEYTQSFSTEASRIYSVILQRQSLDYIRHALNMYFRFSFFLSFLKFEILVSKGSPVAIKLPTPLTAVPSFLSYVHAHHDSLCYPTAPKLINHIKTWLN